MAWPITGTGLIGAPNLDTGLTAVPTSASSITASACWVLGICFTNASGAVRTVTVTNTAGTELVKAMDVPSTGSPTYIPVPFQPLTGLKWLASGANVNGQIWGYV